MEPDSEKQPTQDWIEEARKAYSHRYYDEHGDNYENSSNAYGDHQ